jgi:hypothetical protein
MQKLNYALFSFVNLNFVILLNKIYCVNDDDEFGWDPCDWIRLWNDIGSVNLVLSIT